jgi:transcriptional regulator with XRE-family HTH domain
MQPFGETVLAWRLARGMTQADLARAARVPRPNLSAIERGEREVTLKTLRALALALDVRPGILADGIPPETGARPLSRTRLERIARAAAQGLGSPDSREAALAAHLRRALSSRLGVGVGRQRPSLRSLAGADRAYFHLRTRESQATLASLVDRVGLELERK